MKRIITVFITLVMVISLFAGFEICVSADTTTSGPTQTILDMGDTPIVKHTTGITTSGYLKRKTTHTTTVPEQGDPPTRAAQLAFPGAEGFGQYSQGGRGGDVYYVTNLNDTGSGSLRYGIQSATGPRTILFAVAGTIKVESIIHINKSNITIAGQSAPGEGITIRKYGLQIEASHIILRYFRVRMGDEVYSVDGIKEQYDCINIYQGENIIVDHVSSSWSTDENLSIGEDRDPQYRMTNVTVQNTIISECFWDNGAQNKIRGYGSLIRGSFGAKYSYIKNAYIHTARRIPRVGNYQEVYNDPSGVLLDFRNNVLYNMKGDYSSYSWGNEYTSYNFVNNYLISGPNTNANVILFEDHNPVSKGYFNNNVINGNVISNADSWNYITRQEPKYPFFQTIPYSNNNNVHTLEGTAIYDYVMSGVGASKDYDSVDDRILNDVRNKTGHYINDQREVGEWPALDTGTPIVDTDSDGMQDSWETAKGLNANNPNDGNSYTLSKVYTNLEMYLNDGLPTPLTNHLTTWSNLTDISSPSGNETFNTNINLDGIVTGSDVTFTVSTQNNWITPSLSNGTFTANGSKALTITLDANESSVSRQGVISIVFDKTSNSNYTGASTINIYVNQSEKSNQAAPTGLSLVAPSTVLASDGRIAGTSADMEYKLSTDSSYTPVTGAEITGLSYGTYNIRYASKPGYYDGAVTTVELYLSQAAPAGLLFVAPTTYFLTDGKILGTTSEMEYKLSTDSTYTPASDIETTGLAAGTYNIRYAAKAGYFAGDVINIVVPDGENLTQAAPEGLVGVPPTSDIENDGKIVGSTTEMEYKLSSDENYIPATDVEITGLVSGTYLVRYAAKIGYNASDSTVVEIIDGPPAREFGIILSNSNPVFGDVITASVYVKHVPTIAGIQATLGFNPAVLTLWDKTSDVPATNYLRAIDNSGAMSLTQLDPYGEQAQAFEALGHGIDKVNGLVDFAFSSILMSEEQTFLNYIVPDPETELTLVTVRFKVTGAGDANLRIARSGDEPYNYSNSNGLIIEEDFYSQTSKKIKEIIPSFYAEPVCFTVYGYVADAGATVTIDGKSATADENGYFAISDIYPGTYDMTIAKNGALTRTIAVTVVDSDAEVSLSSKKITLIFGDGNCDGGINVSDLSGIKNLFGKNFNDPEFVVKYDVNNDDSINVSDLSVAKNSFGLSVISYPEWEK